jgi:RHS repeat-associated protein
MRFAYDALGRLSIASQASARATVWRQQFTYDALGNLLGLTNTAGSSPAADTTLSYLATDRDRICRIDYGADRGTACNVTYDQLGNIVAQPTRTGLRQLSYLADGSVRRVIDGSTAAHFRYDAFGEVQELDLTSSTSPDTRHDRRYGGLIAWRDEEAGASPTSVLTRTIPGPDGFVATRHGAGGPWVFAFGEARGNRFFTDETGAFVQDVDYLPFGEATSSGAQPGSSLYSHDQWNGGDALAALGVSHLGARLYDPVIGRFLSRDPLLIPRTAATTNPYAFAMNDPVNRSDPSGLVADPPDGICKRSDGQPCQGTDGSGGGGGWGGDSGGGGGWGGGGWGGDMGNPGLGAGWDPAAGDVGGGGGSYSSPSLPVNAGRTHALLNVLPFPGHPVAPSEAYLRGYGEPSIWPTFRSTTLFERHPTLKTVAIGAAIVGAVALAATGVGAVLEAGVGTAVGAVGVADATTATLAVTAATHPEEVEDIAVGAEIVVVRGGAAVVRLGQAGEAAVRAVVDIGDKAKIFVEGRGRIPDGITNTVLSEVKNVQSLSFTQQLRDFASFASQKGLRFDLYIRAGARLSQPLRDADAANVVNILEIPTP